MCCELFISLLTRVLVLLPGLEVFRQSGPGCQHLRHGAVQAGVAAGQRAVLQHALRHRLLGHRLHPEQGGVKWGYKQTCVLTVYL